MEHKRFAFPEDTTTFINRYKPNYYIRATNAELTPTKVKIQGSVRLPVLEIPHVKGDLRIAVFASDAMQKGGYVRTQRFVFRNTSHAVATIGTQIKKPFEVVGLKICGEREATMVASVKPGACAEVFVKCTLGVKDLEEFAEALDTTKGAACNNAVLIRRDLNISLKGCAVLATSFEAKIYYPIFEVQPTILNFGNIWIGNSRKESFTIYNYSGRFF